RGGALAVEIIREGARRGGAGPEREHRAARGHGARRALRDHPPVIRRAGRETVHRHAGSGRILDHACGWMRRRVDVDVVARGAGITALVPLEVASAPTPPSMAGALLPAMLQASTLVAPAAIVPGAPSSVAKVGDWSTLFDAFPASPLKADTVAMGPRQGRQ